nr:hypothetical protein [Tanacetum cinerariifolium]
MHVVDSDCILDTDVAGGDENYTNGWLHDTDIDNVCQHICQHTKNDRLKFIREEMQSEVIMPGKSSTWFKNQSWKRTSTKKLVEMKNSMEAREKLENIISEYDSVTDARNNNTRELRHANLETGLVVNLVSV